MRIRTIFLVTILVILVVPLSGTRASCTSFLLKRDNGLYFAHSLNQENLASVPGMIFLNQRDSWKKGYSWNDLLKVNQETSPSLVWKSQFGSVTFNPAGRDFPDGGMNEKGLFIWEMTLEGTQFVKDQSLPTLFMMQWMQYQLDNFSSVDQVIDYCGEIALDGWDWHFFVADRSGKSATIEFLDGKPVVHSGDNMPIPLLANTEYAKEIRWLKKYRGFGGELDITPGDNNTQRFIHGARMIHDFSSQDPIDYCFGILDTMSKNVRWSVVFDVNQMKVYFKTNLNQVIRFFSFSPSDFARTSIPLMLDIECPGPGDVKSKFVSSSKEKEERLLAGFCKILYEASAEYRTILKDQHADNEMIAKTILKRVEAPDISADFDIAGEWKGIVKYPATDGMMEFPMIMKFSRVSGELTGIANDGTVLVNLRLTNVEHVGGLLSFTAREPKSGYVLLFRLSVSINEIKGSIEFNKDTEQRRGMVSLKRTIKIN